MPTAARIDSDLVNPNFIASDTKSILYARKVLNEEWDALSGVISQELEEHTAARWERSHGQALVRTWEECYWADGNPKHNHNELFGPGNCECGATLVREIADSYFRRRTRLEGDSEPTPLKPLDMDPQVARDEIERLMRAARPKEFESRINQLRAVIGLEPVEFQDEYRPAPLIVQEDQIAAMQPVTAPRTKRENFYAMTVPDQKLAVAGETDLEFLDSILHEGKKTSPWVKRAINKRIEELTKPPVEE